MVNAQSITSSMVLFLGSYCALESHQPIQERISTMNNSQSWISSVQQQVYGKSFWQFVAQDDNKRTVILEWQIAGILSNKLAVFKKEIADLAARTTATSEVEFLRQYPAAVTQEMFLKPCAPLFLQGVDNVKWDTVAITIRETIKQFYCADIKNFGEQVLKMLSSDLYFFAHVTDQSTGKLLGFCMLAITPNLPYGDVKLISIAIEPAEQHRGLEALLLGSLFAIIKPQRIFTAIRSTNIQEKEIFTSCGFTINENPQQDPNHKLNLEHWIVMEYKTDMVQTIATRLS